MKLLVESEISATAYKKLVLRLKGLNRKELWEILDHYIFHIMEDKEVNELLALLEEKEAPKPEDPVVAEVDEPELDSDRFRPVVAFSIPSDDDLESNKHYLELLYDQNCFDSYMNPKVKTLTAQKLVAFAEKNELPVCDHWKEYA